MTTQTDDKPDERHIRPMITRVETMVVAGEGEKRYRRFSSVQRFRAYDKRDDFHFCDAFLRLKELYVPALFVSKGRRVSAIPLFVMAHFVHAGIGALRHTHLFIPLLRSGGITG